MESYTDKLTPKQKSQLTALSHLIKSSFLRIRFLKLVLRIPLENILQEAKGNSLHVDTEESVPLPEVHDWLLNVPKDSILMNRAYHSLLHLRNELPLAGLTGVLLLRAIAKDLCMQAGLNPANSKPARELLTDMLVSGFLDETKNRFGLRRRDLFAVRWDQILVMHINRIPDPAHMEFILKQLERDQKQARTILAAVAQNAMLKERANK